MKTLRKQAADASGTEEDNHEDTSMIDDMIEELGNEASSLTQFIKSEKDASRSYKIKNGAAEKNSCRTSTPGDGRFSLS